MENMNFNTRKPAKRRRAHLVGIGGSGMRALARVLLGKGWRLSGSDLAIGGDDPLTKAGICCFSGHAADQVSRDVECVIYSSAISAANPELRRAAELGIPVLSYAEMLGLLMQGTADWPSPEPMASRPPRPWPPKSSWPRAAIPR